MLIMFLESKITSDTMGCITHHRWKKKCDKIFKLYCLGFWVMTNEWWEFFLLHNREKNMFYTYLFNWIESYMYMAPFLQPFVCVANVFYFYFFILCLNVINSFQYSSSVLILYLFVLKIEFYFYRLKKFSTKMLLLIFV